MDTMYTMFMVNVRPTNPEQLAKFLSSRQIDIEIAAIRIVSESYLMQLAKITRGVHNDKLAYATRKLVYLL